MVLVGNKTDLRMERWGNTDMFVAVWSLTLLQGCVTGWRTQTRCIMESCLLGSFGKRESGLLCPLIFIILSAYSALNIYSVSPFASSWLINLLYISAVVVSTLACRYFPLWCSRDPFLFHTLFVSHVFLGFPAVCNPLLTPTARRQPFLRFRLMLLTGLRLLFLSRRL
jgi:hypothetical protein